MTKSIHLDSFHYAAKWPLPKEGEFNDLKVVNQAGLDYANMADGPAKEEKLFELVRYFHGYVFKYTDLIVRGHLPAHSYNSDTRKFLNYFLPKGSVKDQEAFSKAAKHLHLAFPQQNASDIYDTLTLLLLRCIKRYDPHYVAKMQKIVKIIDVKRKRKKPFTIESIQNKIDFDPIGALKNLARKGHIKAIRGAGKKLIGYKVTRSWPPNKAFLSAEPIGITYVVQLWFRYYLQDHIHEQMKTLEARAWDKMLQLEHRNDDMTGMDNGPHAGQDIPNADGELVDSAGNSWAADMSLVRKQLDISQITPSWVQGTSDKLFANMTVRERQLIYLYYVEDMPWKQLASTMGMTINQVQKIHGDIITYLQSKFHVK
jgi:hypothetical protein